MSESLSGGYLFFKIEILYTLMGLLKRETCHCIHINLLNKYEILLENLLLLAGKIYLFRLPSFVGGFKILFYYLSPQLVNSSR